MYLETLEKLDIELTNLCNLKCPYCLRVSPTMKDSLKVSNQIDYNTLTNFILKLKKYNLKEVILMGSLSEPTLYYKFLEFIKFLKDLDLVIHISSNANTHNEAWWINLANLLTKEDSIIFSVDGSNQKLYKKYRINGNLETVKKHFQAFASVQEHNSNHCEIYIQTIDFPWYNCDEEYDKITKLFDPENKFKYYRPHLKNYYPEKESGKLAKLEKFFKHNIESKIKNGTALKPECYVLKNKNLYMTYLGDIIPCGVVYEKYLFGDERKEGKIPNLYDDTNSKDFSKEFKDKFNSFFKEHFEKTIFKNYQCLRRCNKIYSELLYSRNPKKEKDNGKES